jgi:predicted GIY-YIG superfamily endonuclease
MINGKVYKITNNIDSDIYIGSTTNSLQLRFAVHILTAKYIKSKHRLLYEKMNLLGSENFTIELVDEITCHDKQGLKVLEGYYILL